MADCDSLSSQLREKVLKELDLGNKYEALQYVESFVARKKKQLTPVITSELIFMSAQLLLDAESFHDCGSLMVWYIETGGGETNKFRIKTKDQHEFCDLEKLISLIASLSPENAACIVNKISTPIGTVINKLDTSELSNVNASILNKNLLKLEDIAGNAYLVSGQFLQALKCACKLGDMGRAAIVLHTWASKGYKYEYPLFFARATLHLLAEGQQEQAIELVSIVKQRAYIEEEKFQDENNNSNPCPALAIWHLCIIIIDLASLSTVPLNTKYKIFLVLCGRYMPLLKQIDEKMATLLHSAGRVSFTRGDTNNSKPSGGGDMLSMLQNVIGGSGGGGMDLQGMIKMMQGGAMGMPPQPTRGARMK